MQDEPRWVFVGGRRHGHELLKQLFADRVSPSLAFILAEDAHELEKHSADIAALCSRHGVPFRLAKKVELSDAARIGALRPRLMVVMGWRTIIPPEILALPAFGCVALHDSLLPRYRGFAPINWAVINGEAETGVTLFYLDEGVDSGPIIAQRRIPIGERDTAATVYDCMTTAAVALVSEYLPSLLRERVPATPQDPNEATFTCSRTPDDGLIDWHAPTQAIYDLVRALARPYPGAFTHLGERRLLVWEAEPVPWPPRFVGRIPGRVVALGPDFMDVLTGDGAARAVGAARGPGYRAAVAGGAVRPRHVRLPPEAARGRRRRAARHRVTRSRCRGARSEPRRFSDRGPARPRRRGGCRGRSGPRRAGCRPSRFRRHAGDGGRARGGTARRAASRGTSARRGWPPSAAPTRAARRAPSAG